VQLARQAPPLPAATLRLEARSKEGHRLAGSLIPGRPGGEPRPLLLGFGGNAWNGDAVALTLHRLFPDADVAAFHYRGYAPSEGSPGAAAFLADAPILHDRLRADRANGEGIVLVGFSIGSAVAAELAARRDVRGLILVTPFDSLARLAGDHYPWLPARFLLRHRLEPAVALRAGNIPVAIIAAEHHSIVPAPRTAALRAAAGDRLVFDRTLAGTGHNDLYDDHAFAAAMQEALQRIEAVRPAGRAVSEQ
jgi:pimeloyl-ACP methyl ester carboxylesterase